MKNLNLQVLSDEDLTQTRSQSMQVLGVTQKVFACDGRFRKKENVPHVSTERRVQNRKVISKFLLKTTTEAFFVSNSRS